MGDPKMKVGEEIADILYKLIIWAAYIVPTVAAKFVWDKNIGKLSTWKIAVKVIISLFIGYLAAITCETFGWQKQGRVAVPVATLWSDSLMNLIMSREEYVYKIADRLIPKWLRGSKSEKKE